MSIFGRRDNPHAVPASSGGPQDASPSPSPSPRAQQRRITHIAPGSRIQGELTGPTELLIEGEVQGEIRVEAPVMVGTEGVVHGPITAQVVRVGGRVFGSINATERVEVAPSGTLEGDVSAPRIVIAEGAFFKGRVEMKGEKAEETRRAKAAGEPAAQMKTTAGESGHQTKATAPEPGSS